MKIYKFLLMYQMSGFDHVMLKSSDPEELKAVSQAFAKRTQDVAPQGKIGWTEHNGHTARFTHLKEQTQETFWWIYNYLSGSGWEPVAANLEDGHFLHVHLRKEVIQ